VTACAHCHGTGVEPTRTLVLSVTVAGLRLVSEMNRHEKRGETWARKAAQKEAVTIALLRTRASPKELRGRVPLRVTIARLRHPKTDADNRASSAKWAIDAVATWIGIDDGDERVTYVVEDRPGPGLGVQIEIEEVRP
jgi:hypothetical protein